jgi:hypothetical protein
MKKIVFFVLAALVLCLPAFAGGGQAGRSSTPDDGLTTIKVFGSNQQYNLSGRNATFSDWYNGSVKSLLWDKFCEELAKRGVKLELDLVMLDQLDTVFQTMLATKKLGDYDWVNGGNNVTENIKLGLINQNQLYALNKAIDQYSDGTAKNFYTSGVGRNFAKLATLEDGNYYWLTHANATYYKDESNYFGTAQVGMIRQDWLDKLGLAMPRTLDDFYNVIVAFRQRDANGNGERDEIINVAVNGFNTAIAQWFGLGTDLVSSIDYRAVSPWYQTHIKDYFIFMNKLYTAGVLQLSGSENEITPLMSNREGYENTWLAETWLEPAVNTPAGTPKSYFAPLVIQAFSDTPARVWHSVGISVDSSSLFFIPANAKNVEGAVRMIDYLSTDDYAILTELGIEGYTFEYGPDGKAQKFSSNPNGQGIDIPLIYERHPAMWTYRSILPRFEKMDRDEELLQATNMGRDNGYADGYRLKYTFGNDFYSNRYPLIESIGGITAFPTNRETERIAAIMPDLTTYSEELITSLIMGEKSLDNWNTYINDLKRLGLDELIAIYQARIDRAR